MSDYTYTDADWRENAKYGLVGVTADDATEHWDRWLAEHEAALLEGLADEIRHKQHAESIRQMLREKARERREERAVANQMPAEMREQADRLRLAAGGYYGREMLAGADALDRLADVIEYAEAERARIHRVPAASMYAHGEYDALTEIACIARGETGEREK